MRKSLGFILVVFSLFSISISYANDCTKACSAEGRPFIDTKISDEKFFLFNYCKLRCHSDNFACRGNPIPDDVRRLKNDANWANNCKAMSDGAYVQKLKDEQQEIRAEKKARMQERHSEIDRKHQERMDAIRNQQNQAAAAQATTQTSQSSYPSDSQASNSSGKRSGFVYDNTDHSDCIAVTGGFENGWVFFKNNCNFEVYLQFCQVTDNHSSYSQFKDGAKCPGHSGGADLSPGETARSPSWGAFNNFRYFNYVCKKGFNPVNSDGRPIFKINESFTCRKLE